MGKRWTRHGQATEGDPHRWPSRVHPVSIMAVHLRTPIRQIWTWPSRKGAEPYRRLRRPITGSRYGPAALRALDP
jgi:hypothetical protein